MNSLPLIESPGGAIRIRVSPKFQIKFTHCKMWGSKQQAIRHSTWPQRHPGGWLVMAGVPDFPANRRWLKDTTTWRHVRGDLVPWLGTSPFSLLAAVCFCRAQLDLMGWCEAMFLAESSILVSTGEQLKATRALDCWARASSRNGPMNPWHHSRHSATAGPSHWHRHLFLAESSVQVTAGG